EEALRRQAKKIGVWPLLCLALYLLEGDSHYKVTVPSGWSNRRARWLLRSFGERLRPLVTKAVDEQQERVLRGLSWLLLPPDRTLASARRELLPTRSRLSFIAGRPLNRRQALARLWRRQTGAFRRRSDRV